MEAFWPRNPAEAPSANPIFFQADRFAFSTVLWYFPAIMDCLAWSHSPRGVALPAGDWPRLLLLDEMLHRKQTNRPSVISKRELID